MARGDRTAWGERFATTALFLGALIVMLGVGVATHSSYWDWYHVLAGAIIAAPGGLIIWAASYVYRL